MVLEPRRGALVVKLWKHQEAVIACLIKGHFLLLWDPGAGKTAPLICAGASVGGRQLWITASVLIPQTIADIAAWRPGVRVQRITSGKSIVDDTADIVIVSYDLMRRVEIWKQLFRLYWESMVADEGHALGHGNAARTRAMYGATIYSKGALYTRSNRVWIATGTPVLNSPDELHPHLSRLFPNLVQGFVQKALFLERYCVTVQKTFGPIIVGARNTEELRQILSKCASRVKLSDVTDLPPLTVDTLPVEISPADRRAVEATMTDEQRAELNVVLTQLEGGDEAGWQKLQAMLLPLASTRRVLALAKSRAAIDLIRSEIEGGADRVVLFGVHVTALQAVADACHHMGARLLMGETRAAERLGAVAGFNAGTVKVLVASVRVAGFGLNLQSARRAIFLETDWTAASIDQAIARLYRAGQARPVRISILTVADSIDARVADIVRRKRRIVTQLLEETS
jgi:SNF2 family DNA or RNA helicase